MKNTLVCFSRNRKEGKMSYFIRWSDRHFKEVEEPIQVDFKEAKPEDLRPGMDEKNTLTAQYESSVGAFRFLLDAKGNAVLDSFAADCAYVKLPTHIQDASRQCYPIKQIHNVYGGEKLKGLYIPEGIESVSGHLMGNSLLDVYFPKSLIFFPDFFHDVPQFSFTEGCRVWYAGTRDEWNSLIESCGNKTGQDYSIYPLMVRFYESDMDILIPELDFETITEPNGVFGTIRVCNYTGKARVPESWTNDQSDVTIIRIGENAFAGNELLTEITIPNSIHEIGDMAFLHVRL